MRQLLLAVLAVLLLDPAALLADGCKFRRDGRAVPENEQRALIEWENGTETLHVAAHSEPTTEGTVWVVPIRARAAAVRAEPVEEFPVVTYYEPLAAQTQKRLQNAIQAVAVLDSGGLCCPILPGLGCGAPAATAEEVSRVEKLGMVVTVVRADSRTELIHYLDRQGVNSEAVDLSSLEPYFGGEAHSFVCGWVASQNAPTAAAAVRVTFPSPSVWFPLRPTSLYANPVRTVVSVRGFVKPIQGCELEGLACEYVYGHVEARGVPQAFTLRSPGEYSPYYRAGSLQPITRVTLTPDPRRWDRDLELVPGTTPAGTKALVVQRGLDVAGWALSGLLGAALGLFIPWATVPRAERRWPDWVGGALTGAAIVGSLWLSVLVFTIWRNVRFSDGPRQPSRYVALPLLAVAHFGIVYGVCRTLIDWVAEG
jgi:hypothetical protein